MPLSPHLRGKLRTVEVVIEALIMPRELSSIRPHFRHVFFLLYWYVSFHDSSPFILAQDCGPVGT